MKDIPQRPPVDQSAWSAIKNCEGCIKRKEALKEMLMSGKFWTGVVVGVAGCWAYRKYAKKS